MYIYIHCVCGFAALVLKETRVSMFGNMNTMIWRHIYGAILYGDIYIWRHKYGAISVAPYIWRHIDIAPSDMAPYTYIHIHKYIYIYIYIYNARRYETAPRVPAR